MDIAAFRQAFWERFEGKRRNEPCYAYWDPVVISEVDLCPKVKGKSAIRNLQLLNLAFGFLGEKECYLEVGVYQGKSLLSAMLNNPVRPVYACDNFSQFDANSLEITLGNLEKHGMLDRVAFYDCDFAEIYTPGKLPVPIGLYFYDGAHDEANQFKAIKKVEPFLADEALVIIDDWRRSPSSKSYARHATLRATRESDHDWRVLYELPARFNGDCALWWNGVGVLSFHRKQS